MLKGEHCKRQNIFESWFNVTYYVTLSRSENCDVDNHIFCLPNVVLQQNPPLVGSGVTLKIRRINPTRRLAGTQPRISEAALSKVAQSWPWGSQVAVKKKKKIPSLI